jgi:hypothetical protein
MRQLNESIFFIKKLSKFDDRGAGLVQAFRVAKMPARADLGAGRIQDGSEG